MRLGLDCIFTLCLWSTLCYIYVASVPISINGVVGVVPSVYLVIYVIYRLVVWMKTLQICKKKQRNQLILETEEPDRLTHPEDYEHDEDIYIFSVLMIKETITHKILSWRPILHVVTVSRNMALFNNSLPKYSHSILWLIDSHQI